MQSKLGDHTNCKYCNSQKPTIKDAEDLVNKDPPKIQKLTQKEEEFCKYWEENLTSTGGKNPDSKITIKKHGYTYKYCLKTYNSYKPYVWDFIKNKYKYTTLFENAVTQKFKKLNEGYFYKLQDCKRTSKTAGVKMLFKIMDTNIICKICKKITIKTRHYPSYAYMMCNGVICCGDKYCYCSTNNPGSVNFNCDECGTQLYFSYPWSGNLDYNSVYFNEEHIKKVKHPTILFGDHTNCKYCYDPIKMDNNLLDTKKFKKLTQVELQKCKNITEEVITKEAKLLLNIT